LNAIPPCKAAKHGYVKMKMADPGGRAVLG